MAIVRIRRRSRRVRAEGRSIFLSLIFSLFAASGERVEGQIEGGGGKTRKKKRESKVKKWQKEKSEGHRLVEQGAQGGNGCMASQAISKAMSPPPLSLWPSFPRRRKHTTRPPTQPSNLIAPPPLRPHRPVMEYPGGVSRMSPRGMTLNGWAGGGSSDRLPPSPPLTRSRAQPPSGEGGRRSSADDERDWGGGGGRQPG